MECVLNFILGGRLMINILILEDDLIQGTILSKIIKEQDPHFTIYQTDNEAEGLRIANETNIDLFFVDIYLKDSSGLSFAKKIRSLDKYKLTWIVFVTTHIKYMVKAFKEIHCYDYVIKPYSKEAIQNLTLTLLNEPKVDEIPLINEKNYILFEQKGVCLKLYINEIIYIEVCLRTSIIHTKNEIYELNNMSLKKIKELTNNFDFIQVHRSYIVNKDLIKAIDKTTSPWSIILNKHENKIPVGNKFKSTILHALRLQNG